MIMTDVIVTNNILGIFIMIGIFAIIGVFLIQLYNILYGCTQYEFQISIVILAVGCIGYIFVELGIMLTIGQAETDATLLEYNMYNWLMRAFIILIWIFWFAELFMYSAQEIVKPLRMNKRKQEKYNRMTGFNRYQT